MSSPRVQVRGPAGDAVLRPMAAPVDTYVQPASVSKLGQLAQSLSGLAGGLSRFSDGLYEKQSKEAQERGAQFAREMHEKRIDFRDAVKNGTLPAEKNPFFLVGLKEQLGKASAGDYANDLKIAAAQDPTLQESTDQNDFRAFEAQFRGGWLKEHLGDENRDLHFERGFGNLADAYTLDQENQFASQVAQRLTQKASDAVYSQVYQTLRDHADEPEERRIQMISGVMDAMLFDNPKIGRMVSLGSAKAIIDYATRNHDLDVLKLIEKIPGGPGSTLVRPEINAMVEEAEGRIRSDKESILSLTDREHEAQQRQQRETLWTDLGSQLLSAQKAGTLNSFDLAPWRKKMLAIDPSPQASQTVDAMWENILHPKPNDGAVFRNLRMRVYGNNPNDHRSVGFQEVGKMLATGQLTDEQYGVLINDLQERARLAQEGGGGNPINKLLDDKLYTTHFNALRQRFISEYGYNDATIRNMASNAQGVFMDRYLGWVGQHPDAALGEREAFLTSLEQEVFLTEARDDDLKDAFTEARGGEQAAPKAGEQAKPAGRPKAPTFKPVARARWDAVKNEITEWSQHQRASLSPQTIALMKAQGVRLDPAAALAWMQHVDTLPFLNTGQ